MHTLLIPANLPTAEQEEMNVARRKERYAAAMSELSLSDAEAFARLLEDCFVILGFQADTDLRSFMHMYFGLSKADCVPFKEIIRYFAKQSHGATQVSAVARMKDKAMEALHELKQQRGM